MKLNQLGGKLLKNSIPLLLMVLFGQCDKQLSEAQGSVSFNLYEVTKESGRVLQDIEATSIVVTVTNSEGEEVLSNENIPLTDINSELYTTPIAINTGAYSITDLVVYNQEVAVYAIPLEGSELAYLVADPAPVDFEVVLDETTMVDLEVVSFEGADPEDFGFVSFSFDVVSTIDLLLSVFEFDIEEESFKNTKAKLTIELDNEVLTTKDIKEQPYTVLRLPSEFSTCKLTLDKEGYESLEKELSIEAVESYIGLSLSMTFVSGTDLTNGLVADYLLNGDALDASGNTNNGTLDGPISGEDRYANPEGAYYFDGINDQIIIPHDERYNELPISISFWAKFNSLNPAILGLDVNDNIQSGVWFSVGEFEGTASKVAVNYGNGGPGMASSRKTAISESELTKDTWYHIVGVVENEASVLLYVNGVLNEGQTTGTASSYLNKGSSGSLGRVWSTSDWFHGSIDEVKVYNRVLSANEILSLYNN